MILFRVKVENNSDEKQIPDMIGKLVREKEKFSLKTFDQIRINRASNNVLKPNFEKPSNQS